MELLHLTALYSATFLLHVLCSDIQLTLFTRISSATTHMREEETCTLRCCTSLVCHLTNRPVTESTKLYIVLPSLHRLVFHINAQQAASSQQLLKRCITFIRQSTNQAVYYNHHAKVLHLGAASSPMYQASSASPAPYKPCNNAAPLLPYTFAKISACAELMKASIKDILTQMTYSKIESREVLYQQSTLSLQLLHLAHNLIWPYFPAAVQCKYVQNAIHQRL